MDKKNKAALKKRRPPFPDLIRLFLALQMLIFTASEVANAEEREAEFEKIIKTLAKEGKSCLSLQRNRLMVATW